ncbi:hypothetical protein PSTG_18514, partial [Puccinia striiformis f. sp. tritici PST-78]
MHHAAISLGGVQQVDSTLQDIDIDTEHHALSSRSRISISNLLNPIINPRPGLSADFLAERHENKFPIIVMSPNGFNQQLCHTSMIELRKKHDTENHKTHSGNEIKKQQNFLVTDKNQSQSDLPLQPSECSKLVSLLVKENSSQRTSIDRMHRWNIQVQFKLSEVRNTSTHVDVNAQLHVQCGTISPTNELTDGKYAVIIKDK